MSLPVHGMIAHYESYFGGPLSLHRPGDGRSHELVNDFRIVSGRRRDSAVRVYATVGMSNTEEAQPIEMFMLQRYQEVVDEQLLTILAAVAHYHQTASRLALGHTVNFGLPWQPGSRCTFGLLSLPYLDGPQLERPADSNLQVLWLLPITAAERQYKMQRLLEAIERQFEVQEVDYLNPLRASVVVES